MITVRARVKDGRLVVDEPTDLPDGTEIALIGEDDASVLDRLRTAPPAEERLSPQETKELQQIAGGPFVPHEEVKRKLASRKV